MMLPNFALAGGGSLTLPFTSFGVRADLVLLAFFGTWASASFSLAFALEVVGDSAGEGGGSSGHGPMSSVIRTM